MRICVCVRVYVCVYVCVCVCVRVFSGLVLTSPPTLALFVPCPFCVWQVWRHQNDFCGVGSGHAVIPTPPDPPFLRT